MVRYLDVDETFWNKDVPHERCNHMAVFLDGRIVVLGGIFNNVFTGHDHIKYDFLAKNVIWTYRLDTFQWEKFVIPIDETIPPGSRFSSLTAIGRVIYMFGGQLKRNVNNVKQVTNCTWMLSGTAQHGFKWSELKNKDNKHAPSPRTLHGAWAYKNKLWIFGGKGMPLQGYLNEANDQVAENIPGSMVYNNQLLCFNPSLQKWTNPKCDGNVPSPRTARHVTHFGDKIWHCRMHKTPNRNGLWELNMPSLVWTKIKVARPVKPSIRKEITFTAINATTCVLHGGYAKCTGRALGDTWLFDLPSASWRKYTGSADHARSSHSATRGTNNSIIFFGGCSSNDNLPVGTKEDLCDDVYIIRLGPESLLKLTSKVVCDNRAVLQSYWKYLPGRLHAQLLEMCQMK